MAEYRGAEALKILEILNGMDMGYKPTSEEIIKLANVTLLDLSYSDTPIRALPNAIGKLSNLTKLDLWGTKITTLPDGFGKLSNLTELYLYNTQIRELPDDFGNLSSLTKLYLNGTNITSLPDGFGNLSSLTELNLSWTDITSLPDGFGNLSSLTELYLSHTQIRALPDDFAKLSNLKKLGLSYLHLDKIPKSVFDLNLPFIRKALFRIGDKYINLYDTTLSEQDITLFFGDRSLLEKAYYTQTADTAPSAPTPKTAPTPTPSVPVQSPTVSPAVSEPAVQTTDIPEKAAWLQIGDLHIYKDDRWNLMSRRLLTLAEQLCRDYPEGSVALMIVGDFTNYTEHDFTKAQGFLNNLIEKMHLDRKKDVFLVPGNHDVNGSADRQQRIDESKAAGNAAHIEADEKDFQSYKLFVQSLGIYGDVSESFKVHVRTWRDRLNILHLNTVLTADGKDKKEQTVDITAATDKKIINALKNQNLPCIALGHNSYYDIEETQQDSLANLFERVNISAYLCGDRHRANRRHCEQIIPLPTKGYNTACGIPNIVGYKGAIDKTDDYSECGILWHTWNRQEKSVTVKFLQWDVNHNFDFEHAPSKTYLLPFSPDEP